MISELALLWGAGVSARTLVRGLWGRGALFMWGWGARTALGARACRLGAS